MKFIVIIHAIKKNYSLKGGIDIFLTFMSFTDFRGKMDFYVD